ncbi:uncharacterized protein LOC143023005 [Oratosquilla oratoria]|uniref:uncharacterized protein LOC143023005 n=1 Tax=Oratosquilla oratoria TaxID=337810 RepID=UPI003F76904E
MTKWMPEAKRWVSYFKEASLNIAVYTNNGVERQNETLKYSYLEKYSRNAISISELLTVVINSFLPDSYHRYIELNVRASEVYRKYNTHLPLYLRNRPKDVVNLIKRRLDEDSSNDCIALLDDKKGIFKVFSRMVPSLHHTVTFGKDGSVMPSCTCYFWKTSKLPCKHFCSIFKSQDLSWSWDDLNKSYRCMPILSLDKTIIAAEGGCCDDPVSSDGEADCINLDDSSIVVDDLKERKSKRKRCIDKCTGVIKSILDKVHNLKEIDYLDELHKELLSLDSQIESVTNEGWHNNISHSKEKEKGQ